MPLCRYPYSKLRWVTLLNGPTFVNQEILKINYKNTLQQAVNKISTPENEASTNCNNSNDDDLFKNLERASSSPNNESDLEVLHYLQDTFRTLSPISLDK